MDKMLHSIMLRTTGEKENAMREKKIVKLNHRQLAIAYSSFRSEISIQDSIEENVPQLLCINQEFSIRQPKKWTNRSKHPISLPSDSCKGPLCCIKVVSTRRNIRLKPLVTGQGQVTKPPAADDSFIIK